MTLFIDNSGMSDVAFNNLYTISSQDGGLGLSSVSGDDTVTQVTYSETAGSPATADRLSALANTDFGIPIVITAINGGTDPYSGEDVTGNGFTYILDGVVRVVYDVSQCCGSGIFTFDTSSNHITTPNPVILYHELSHAFRAAQGTSLPNDEPPAETDENVLRTELGLCQRDVNNHGGGCGSGSNCGGSDGGPDGGPPAGGCVVASGGGGCFIVTATTGSAASVELVGLRLLRDRVAMLSLIGSKLIDAIYREYYQFSPPMALRLQADPSAKDAVLRMVVRPLTAWYTLAGALALDAADQTETARAVAALRAACPAGDASRVNALLRAVNTGRSLPFGAPRLAQELAPRLRQAAGLPYVAWGLLEPLTRAWRCADWRTDPPAQVAEWLATAPIDTLPPPAPAAARDAHLRALARFFEFSPPARLRLGGRLARAWPDAAASLARYGFIDSEVYDDQTTDIRG